MKETPRPNDVAFAKLIAILKANGLTAHTNRKGYTVFRKRARRYSRLTGEPR